MGHQVKDAAAKAVANSNRKAPSERTHDDILKTVRKNLAAGLFVMDGDIKYLLAQYEALLATAAKLDDKSREQAALILSLEEDLKGLREHVINEVDLDVAKAVAVTGIGVSVPADKIQMATIEG